MALRVVFQQLLLLSSIVGKQIGSILTAGTSYCCSLCACCPLKKSIKVYVFNNAHRRFQGKRRLLDVRLFVAKFFHFYLVFSMENCIVNIFVDSALHFSSLQKPSSYFVSNSLFIPRNGCLLARACKACGSCPSSMCLETAGKTNQAHHICDIGRSCKI